MLLGHTYNALFILFTLLTTEYLSQKFDEQFQLEKCIGKMKAIEKNTHLCFLYIFFHSKYSVLMSWKNEELILWSVVLARFVNGNKTHSSHYGSKNDTL